MTEGEHSRVPRLHVIVGAPPTDRTLAVVDAVLAGGAPAVQLRAKGLPDRELHALAVEVSARCRQADARCIVNDRADVALAAGADGVHLGAEDLPVAAARALAGAHLLIGGTAREATGVAELARAGADYVGVGPVYETRTKDGLPAPLGEAGLAAAAAGAELPVLAIAGITAARVPSVLAAGAHGVAVASAVTAATDPAMATRELLDALGESAAVSGSRR